ncbi:outer membrane beta-barrel protein [Aurantibacillus circumpalustris]|uniref:outer membrane beta-barrel protein n=1 Tax=Aurantibacillus circumpalustris TaxID=3036359 RepID=UPI00295AE89E|nr:outer membrane beta-barrel protein [Aurantibacillus circumpalustris]
MPVSFKYLSLFVLLYLLPEAYQAQIEDTLTAKKKETSDKTKKTKTSSAPNFTTDPVTSTQIIFRSNDKLQLQGTRIISAIDSILHPVLRIGGYVSTYYAYYDDDSETNNFVLFPTLAPRKDQFSLNMAVISAEYKSSSMRSNITLHYGDVPESSWPATFNLIQEANAGFRLSKKLWFDAGFFKTHIGLESFQPRENIASSMSIPDYYDPYYLSGAKLSYLATSKLTLQASIFNGYNEYIDNNTNKALGFSANYNLSENISLTYNFLTCDETPDAVKTKHQRYYQNFYATFIYDKFTLGIDLNYGVQQHSLLRDTAKAAVTYAGTLVAKYKLHKMLDVYGRLEDFSDPNRILTGSLSIGQYIRGATIGFEIKPQKTAGLSVEWRGLQSDNLIFRQGNKSLNQRNEIIVCLDLWF